MGARRVMVLVASCAQRCSTCMATLESILRRCRYLRGHGAVLPSQRHVARPRTRGGEPDRRWGVRWRWCVCRSMREGDEFGIGSVSRTDMPLKALAPRGPLLDELLHALGCQSDQ